MQVTNSMAGVVKSMDSALKSMDLEKVVFDFCLYLVCDYQLFIGGWYYGQV